MGYGPIKHVSDAESDVACDAEANPEENNETEKGERSKMPFEQNESSEDSIALLKQRLSGFETEEGRLSGLSYVPKSADEVIITTSPKAGEDE